MPPSLAPEIATPRLPLALRACGLPIALSFLLLSACKEPSGAMGPAEKPTATSAASAPPPSAPPLSAPPPSEPPPSFMQIGSVTPDVGEAPAASAAATAAADAPGYMPSASPQSNERGSETPPRPRGGKAAAAGDVPATGGKVGAAAVVSGGTLSEDEVRAAIAQKQSDFKVCYDMGRSASSDFA